MIQRIPGYSERRDVVQPPRKQPEPHIDSILSWPFEQQLAYIVRKTFGDDFKASIKVTGIGLDFSLNIERGNAKDGA